MQDEPTGPPIALQAPPAKKRADGMPRGNRTDTTQLAQRIDRVERMMREGWQTYAIQKRMVQDGVASRTTDRYIADVHRRWEAERLERSEHRVAERIAYYSTLTRELKREKAYAAMMAANRQLDEILGVKAAEKVDARVAVLNLTPQQPEAPQVDLSLLDDSVLDALERAADARLALPASGTAR